MIEVPVAITSFSEADIDKTGIRSLEDLAAFTPGLAFNNFFGQEISKPVIRGVAPLDILGSEANTAVYIDGVYVPEGSNINLAFIDVERIEVLKGPQGAYFGNSAFSGAINYVSLKPTDEYSSKLEAQLGDDGKALLKGTVAGPLIGDQLSGRVSMLYDDFDGTYSNAGGLNQDIGGRKYKTVSGGLLWTPVERFSAYWSLYYSDDEIDPPAMTTNPANCTPSTDPDASNPFLLYCGDLPSVGNNRIATIPGETGQSRDVWRSILNMDWDVSFGTFSSLTGWSNTEGDSFQNGNPGSTNTVFKYTDGNVVPGPPTTYSTYVFDAGGQLIPSVGDNEFSTVSQELRFTSEQDQPLRYAAGLYYYQQKDKTQVSSRSLEIQNPLPDDFAFLCPLCIDVGIPGADFNPIPGSPFGSFFGTFVFGPWFDNFPYSPVAPATSLGINRSKTRDYAAFGSVEYDISAQWRAYAEVRYTDRESDVSGVTVDPTAQNKYDTDYVTWRTSLTYFPTDTSSLYASIAQGEKGGGLSSFQIQGTGDPNLDGSVQTKQYDNEKNLTYELGYKVAFNEGRIMASAAVYYTDWSDIVLRSLLTEYNGMPILPVGIKQNVGDADILGFELGITAALGDHWVAGGGFSYNDTSLDGESDRYEDFPDFGPGGSFNDKEIPRQADTQFNANLTYRNRAFGNWSWYARGDAFYQSDWYIDIPNKGVVPARWRANARLGLETDRYTAELWSTNVFDDDTVDAGFRDVYFSNLTQDTQENAFFPARISTSYPQGRVIGLRVLARFGE